MKVRSRFTVTVEHEVTDPMPTNVHSQIEGKVVRMLDVLDLHVQSFLFQPVLTQRESEQALRESLRLDPKPVPA